MILSAKLPWRKLLFCVALVAALFLCWWAGQLNTASSSAPVLFPTLEELETQRTMLSEYGWEVSQQPTCDQITLPEEFSGEYDSYLALQTECGFSLSPYAGQTVLRCTYQVLNYPGAEQYVYADLLVADGQIIGGDVRSSQLDGFMHSLNYPAQ